jgi:hypothetical protein
MNCQGPPPGFQKTQWRFELGRDSRRVNTSALSVRTSLTDRVWECARRAIQLQICAMIQPAGLIRQQAMRKPPDWHPAAHSRNSGPASFANRVGEQALVSVGIESDSPAYVNTVCPSWLRFLSHMHRCFMTLPTTTLNVHLRDFMILPFGRAVKSDLQKISLSAVSTDGCWFSTNVPAIVISKGAPPICLADFEKHIGPIDSRAHGSDHLILDYMCRALKLHNPNMTRCGGMFLELYFGILKASITDPNRDPKIAAEARVQIGLPYNVPCHASKTDVWRALLPIPELQFYVREPL